MTNMKKKAICFENISSPGCAACDSLVEAEVRKGQQRLLQVVVREQLGPQLGYKAMME
jgi:hypothetical protein